MITAQYVQLIVAFILGAVFFSGIFILVNKKSQQQKDTERDYVLEQIKNSFGQISMEALAKSSEELIKLSQMKLDAERQISSKELENKKNLIDEELKVLNKRLEDVSALVQNLEKDRANKFGQISQLMEEVGRQNKDLTDITSKLRQALSSTKARGQWGERMAEDVLNMAGFIENINYLKQKSLSSSSLRPDFTFLLPNDLKLNMDVKFPLNNYLKYIEAPSESDKNMYCNKFLSDVKARIKEVTSKDYIDPEENTVDYVLLFIPNEQIYSFINEKAKDIIDEAIKNRVIICSPITLFAVLAVIRQAIDNFALEKTSNEILSLLGTFKKQWHLFASKFEKLGKRIDDVQGEYESLNTTRVRQLEKPLSQIEELRNEKRLPPKDLDAIDSKKEGKDRK
jgi:DNA recombination protein RmuC